MHQIVVHFTCIVTFCVDGIQCVTSDAAWTGLSPFSIVGACMYIAI